MLNCLCSTERKKDLKVKSILIIKNSTCWTQLSCLFTDFPVCCVLLSLRKTGDAAVTPNCFSVLLAGNYNGLLSSVVQSTTGVKRCFYVTVFSSQPNLKIEHTIKYISLWLFSFIPSLTHRTQLSLFPTLSYWVIRQLDALTGPVQMGVLFKIIWADYEPNRPSAQTWKWPLPLT